VLLFFSSKYKTTQLPVRGGIKCHESYAK
jgi:hypothetical protein